MISKATLDQLSLAYGLPLRSPRRLSGGHIHETYKIQGDADNFLFQKFNSKVFPNLEEIHSNFAHTQAHIENTSTVQLLPGWIYSKIGTSHVKVDKAMWRASQFIDNSICYEQCQSDHIAWQSGRILGSFHRLTRDIDLGNIKPIIPNFHNMAFRWEQLRQALQMDPAGRVRSISSTIDRVKHHYANCDFLKNSDQELPERLVHNDPKLSNILFDQNGSATHLIDLDTIMSGQYKYDVGDLIRSCCSPMAEDEVDALGNRFNIHWYEKIIEGYAQEVNTFITSTEVAQLHTAGKYMTFIMAIRFLADFINGDVYYHVKYEDQNLNRVKNQLNLFEEMYDQMHSLERIVMRHFG